VGGERGIRKNPWARDAISSKNERGTGARDWSSWWQKPIAYITREGQAPSQGDVCNLHASRKPPWQTALTRPMAKAKTKRCAKCRLVQLRIHGISDRRRKQAISRYGGRRPESRLHHPFTGVA